MRALFDRLADALERGVRGHEVIAATLEAEASEFVRINHGRLRQAGRVERAVARLRLVDGERQALHAITLPGLDAGSEALDAAVVAAIGSLRGAIADSEPDPWLDLNRAPVRSDDATPQRGFDRAAFIDCVAAAAGDADLVGFCSAGPVARGFCSSTGSRQWYLRSRVAFDWSVHLPPDASAAGERRAVKASWSGETLHPDALARAIAASLADASVIARPVRRLAPGSYRVLLAPQGFADLLDLLNWGGFSARADRSGQSPLAQLAAGRATLSPLLTVAEDLGTGLAPGFQGDGYPRPRRVPLIEHGRFAGLLVSPRSAREYGLESNAAAASEVAESLRVAPGELPPEAALARLGTGILVSNLWYLNFSDRPAGRVTGMTRFASLWVEDGTPVAPIEAMRFDDSVYRMLGDRLEALGTAVATLPADATYEARATGGVEVPSALISAVRFAL